MNAEHLNCEISVKAKQLSKQKKNYQETKTKTITKKTIKLQLITQHPLNLKLELKTFLSSLYQLI